MADKILSVLFMVFLAGPAYGYENLVPNPDFDSPDGMNPFYWQHGSTDIERVRRSVFSLDKIEGIPALSVTGGEDRQGYWSCEIRNIKPHKDYIFSFMAYRESFINGKYPSFEVFGISKRLNNHIVSGDWQDFSFVLNSGENTSSMLTFLNEHPEKFSFSGPALIEAPEVEALRRGIERKAKKKIYKKFPLGIYGARAGDFEDVRGAGFNTVIGVPLTAGVLEALGRYGLSGIFLPPEGETPPLSSAENMAGWYVADEPEIRSMPVKDILERGKKAESYMPGLPYLIAIVRADYVKKYSAAFDIVLMDQYPLPNEPLTWLTESLDIAKEAASDKDVWAVIQAFGGEKWKGHGWDRLPSYKEMKALSYLSLIHGADGLMFYDYASMKEDREHFYNVKSLVNELNIFGHVFLSAGRGGSEKIRYVPSDLWRAGYDGSPPVHAAAFRAGGAGDGKYYLIAVNTLERRLKGQLRGLPVNIKYLDEFFSDKRHVSKGGGVIDEFGPYEVKIYISGRRYRDVSIRRAEKPPVHLYLEVAENIQAGLMFRQSLRAGGGMIFELAVEDIKPFWMLNMRFPVDMLFFDSDGMLLDFYEAAQPCADASSCEIYNLPSGVRHVIELGAGDMRKYGIEKGDRLYIE